MKLLFSFLCVLLLDVQAPMSDLEAWNQHNQKEAFKCTEKASFTYSHSETYTTSSGQIGIRTHWIYTYRDSKCKNHTTTISVDKAGIYFRVEWGSAPTSNLGSELTSIENTLIQKAQQNDTSSFEVDL